MPKKKRQFIPKEEAVTYDLCHKSYDDPNNDDDKGILAPRSRYDEWNVDLVDPLELRADMHRTENDAGQIFRNAVWSAFDENFIAELDAPEEGEEDEEEDEDIPTHDKSQYTAEDRQLAQLEKEWNENCAMEGDDPRVQGPLGIELYSNALHQFERETRKVTWLKSKFENELPTQEQVLHQSETELPEHLKESIFHDDGKGYFITVLNSKRNIDPFLDYHEGRQESHKFMKEVVGAKPEIVGAEDVDSDTLMDELGFGSDEEKEKFDCETIISTYSNLENRPNVLQVKKMIKTKLKRNPAELKAKKPTDKYENETTQMRTDENEGEEEEEDEISDQMRRLALLNAAASAGRMPGETSDERKERKKMVKEMRRLKRGQKKALKDAFKEEEMCQRADRPHTDYTKRAIPLGAA